MLEIGRVVDAGREQHDLRVEDAGRRDLGHGIAQPLAVVRDRADADPGAQIGEGAQHQMPVLDHVGHARWRAGIVLEDPEGTGLIAHQIDAADIDIGAMGQVDADHLGPVVRIVQDQLGRHDAGLEDALLVVEVLEEQIEGGHPLHQPGFQRRPVLGRDQARDHVERQDPVDHVALRVDREGDAEIVELALGSMGTPPQGRQAQLVEPSAHRRGMRQGPAGQAEQLAVEAAGVVALEQTAAVVGDAGHPPGSTFGIGSKPSHDRPDRQPRLQPAAPLIGSVPANGP